eukprot:TRINITY_DN1519_c0_g1_i3.p1 TRINITY_DN1519_c0_g1~~TRINITY_DN1519_c0_g1_i3.p1  ORF type:complete len:347 (+),score=78.04 TRINITY_DN1519_c0_g1_i3:340-1380(+)
MLMMEDSNKDTENNKGAASIESLKGEYDSYVQNKDKLLERRDLDRILDEVSLLCKDNESLIQSTLLIAHKDLRRKYKPRILRERRALHPKPSNDSQNSQHSQQNETSNSNVDTNKAAQPERTSLKQREYHLQILIRIEMELCKKISDPLPQEIFQTLIDLLQDISVLSAEKNEFSMFLDRVLTGRYVEKIPFTLKKIYKSFELQKPKSLKEKLLPFKTKSTSKSTPLASLISNAPPTPPLNFEHNTNDTNQSNTSTPTKRTRLSHSVSDLTPTKGKDKQKEKGKEKDSSSLESLLSINVTSKSLNYFSSGLADTKRLFGKQVTIPILKSDSPLKRSHTSFISEDRN